ncbi:DNA mismatch repair endonuclease MutL [Crassaminicella thermophila]|uniref:DNA mismatch repair protein MutL n=1 Tax=Crassaminicella thermophila TaxID=2599308 RepID=A0A5C0SC20_CRATE|nr:DNA mismatch repair endonuclease MutL [Crassaminicella thermophila]QEK12175.1 DNA mismatch repair endonuclease MutL [Crassaminicella thermophila]
MLKRIHKLDKLIANKIAAGEVVDRPVSVVKELVENAIDANASKIIVEIKEGGKTYIRITDDGIGIYESDVEIAFERHATSKIKDADDLNSILSLGFRGEALASIASVSQVELITKTEDSKTGTYLEIHGGEIIERKEIGCPKGTTFVIKNLFYNMPARYQFMKSNAVETGYISDLISKFALAYSNISFRFINNGTIVFTTSGSSSVINNIVSIYGKEIAKNMMYVSNRVKDISIEAYISKPTIARGNKKQQVFFVNGRYVKNKIISDAIEEAYKTLVKVNRFPICFIYLNIPPNRLDVNIHPTKTEIRFDDELYIKDFVVNTLRSKLLEENLIPSIGFEKSKKQLEGYQERIIDLPTCSDTIIKNTKNISEIKPNKEHEKDLVLEDKLSYHANNKVENKLVKATQKKEKINRNNISEFNQNTKTKNIVNEEKLNNKNSELIMNIRILGQIFNTYLIGQDDQTMFLIDQHAAHERILYDTLLKSYKERSAVSQKLLTPILVEVSFVEFEIVKKNVDIFNNLGFEVEEFGMNAFILRSVPVVFGEPEAKEFFMEVVDNFQKNINNSYDIKVEQIISMACKQAIKAKDKLDFVEIKELMKQLAKLENPFTCPHGRPIIVSMTKYEIERKFKRI